MGLTITLSFAITPFWSFAVIELALISTELTTPENWTVGKATVFAVGISTLLFTFLPEFWATCSTFEDTNFGTLAAVTVADYTALFYLTGSKLVLPIVLLVLLVVLAGVTYADAPE